jgi:Phage protein (N4 Gp49/phage Sf6 gene 66) family
MATDEQIEQEIQTKGLTAPRITPDDIEANIVAEHYFTARHGVHGAITAMEYTGREDWAHPDVIENMPAALGLLTFCVLILRNGFTVTGESACASPENFDAVIGSRIARQNAVQKIWPLMGYELRTKLAG